MCFNGGRMIPYSFVEETRDGGGPEHALVKP